MISKLATALLDILSDNQCHKGQRLAEYFLVTRQAIWKAINELQTLSIPIISHGHQGYQLSAGWKLLNHDQIITGLTESVKNDCQNITVLRQTNSTNDDAKAINLASGMAVVVSEYQSQGRGRQGKSWHSPFAANIYFSAKCIFKPETMQYLMALSPFIGIILAKILRQYGIAASVKWPNDIWVKNHKLAGVLIEIEKEAEGIFYVTIGIGVNILDLTSTQFIQQFLPAEFKNIKITSCEKELGYIIDRNEFISNLINELYSLKTQFNSNTIDNLSDIWTEYSALNQQKVRLFSSAQEVIGTEIGIQKDGALLIQTQEGVKPYYMGELSLRPLI